MIQSSPLDSELVEMARRGVPLTEHPIITSTLSHILFDDMHQSKGVVYEKCLNPIPVELLALIWTQVWSHHIYIISNLCL